MLSKIINGQLAINFNCPPKRNKINYGFTLIELSMSLGILSIVTITSAPHFSNFIDKVKLTSTTRQLKNTLSTARQHAISDSHPVNICALEASNEIKCASETGFNSNWSYGWIIYSDVNNNNQYDNNTDYLISISQITDNVGVVFNQQGRLRFFSNGSARSAGFYICVSKRNGDTENTFRHIKLLYSGRSRVVNTSEEKNRLICESARQNTWLSFINDQNQLKNTQ